jgi:hypothetical protein
MKQIFTCALALAVMFGVGYAQTDKKKYMTPNEKSPPMETSATINGKQVWIVYHAPSVRGRKIFGPEGLHKPETNWRLGADQATFLHTDATLDFRGVSVPPGEYSLFIALGKANWELIINKQTGQWGIKRDSSANFDPANNVGKVSLTMSKPPALVEQLKITLSNPGGNRGKLQIDWENVSASANFTAK